MSRIGQKAIPVPKGVTIDVVGKTVSAKGKNGALSLTLVREIDAKKDGETIVVTPTGEGIRERSMWGMQRTLIANMIKGVADGFSRELVIDGVGFRAALQGKTLQLKLGFSHEVNYPVPEGITIKAPTPTSITIFGADRQQVGQVAAEIRAYRKPEPYKGKGIRYSDEKVFRKEGKKK